MFKITYKLDTDIKKLACKEASYAQDINSIFFLSKLTNYTIFHESLKKLLNKKNIFPTQADNLAFMLLITYPIEKINNFNSFEDLKLCFNNLKKESDFTSNGFKIGDKDTFYTCICNERITNVRIFQNNYTGITFQLGCVCNTKYGIIDPKDPNYKSDSKLISEYKEREKEIKEGLPEGYYKLERQQQKFIKEKEKQIKKEEKQIKEKETQIKKELKLLNKKNPGTYILKNCICCKTPHIFNIKKEKICICNTCISFDNKIIKSILIKNIKNNELKFTDCVNCELMFISKNNFELCNSCTKSYQIITCKLCYDTFVINKNDINNSKKDYCEECENKIIKCIDCKCDIISDKTRCYNCYLKFTTIYKKCEKCNKEFRINSDQTWRTFCSSICRTDDNTTSINCKECNIPFSRKKTEDWKKICFPCYKKINKK